MKTVCAWCNKFLGGDPDAAEVTHGICPECLAKQLAEVEKIKETQK